MTLKEAYAVHRTASRNVGKGKGYTAKRLDEALPVLKAFWAVHGSWGVTAEMVESWDKAHSKVN